MTGTEEPGPRMLARGGAWVASTAVVTHEVVLGRDSSIWYGVVVRGDCARITIGALTNVQDNAVVHADTGVPNDIGAEVTIGHGAVVHGRRVGDGCLIGIKAVILGGAEIGEGCIIAAGAVVREHAVIAPRSLVAGVPARVVRAVSEDEAAALREHARHYLELARRHAGP
ncbi:MAG TPA: gamma carbonic anhydrase family protein [Planctomycetota bacterium]|nr:gamma carbonic anhydrase family protein [Planctomycetota bacterium]